MRNLLLRLMYDGTAYHGWQVQPNGITVQEVLQDAIEKISGVRENVVGCSRTDAGVHANDFCCNIKTENPVDCFRLKGSLNAVLPGDIAVKSVSEVPESFHARYDCLSKEYVYRIWNADYENPFLRKYTYHYKNKLDADMLNRQAQAFLGTHDFTSFCSSGSSTEDRIRTVKSVSVLRKGEEIIFRVEADGFLYNMVRIMVGSLIEISENKIKKFKINDIIDGRDRCLAGRTAPPQGLCLNRVIYEDGKGDV